MWVTPRWYAAERTIGAHFSVDVAALAPDATTAERCDHVQPGRPLGTSTGSVVYDPGGHPQAAGPTGEDAMATAEVLEVMPLRIHVASVTAYVLERIELAGAALGLEGNKASRWWRVTARAALGFS